MQFKAKDEVKRVSRKNHLHSSLIPLKPRSLLTLYPVITERANGDTCWIRSKSSSKSGSSMLMPSIFDGAVRCNVGASWKRALLKAWAHEAAATAIRVGKTYLGVMVKIIECFSLSLVEAKNSIDGYCDWFAFSPRMRSMQQMMSRLRRIIDIVWNVAQLEVLDGGARSKSNTTRLKGLIKTITLGNPISVSPPRADQARAWMQCLQAGSEWRRARLSAISQSPPPSIHFEFIFPSFQAIKNRDERWKNR